MKFLVASSALLKLLNGLNGVIPSHPVVPIKGAAGGGPSLILYFHHPKSS